MTGLKDLLTLRKVIFYPNVETAGIQVRGSVCSELESPLSECFRSYPASLSDSMKCGTHPDAQNCARSHNFNSGIFLTDTWNFPRCSDNFRKNT